LDDPEMSFESAARLAEQFESTSLSVAQFFDLIRREDRDGARHAVSPELDALLRRTVGASDLDRTQFAAAAAGALEALRGRVVETGPMLLAGPATWIPFEALRWVNDIEHALVEMVAKAKVRVTVMAPFGTPDALSSTLRPLRALTGAADVCLLTVGTIERLDSLAAGLRRTLPAYVAERTTVRFPRPGVGPWPHAKLLLVDANAGYLGSANFTEGGMGRYFELGVVLSPTQASLLGQYLLPKLLVEVFTETMALVDET
jgi:phosphatidylserine/phosphatidylglycerophosphate/cardiolipin synthase-like enzyme